MERVIDGRMKNKREGERGKVGRMEKGKWR